MSQIENNNYSFAEQQHSSAVPINEMLQKYTKRWPLFLLSLVLTFSVSFGYLYFKTPQYEASSSVLVKDDRKNSGLNETAMFEDLGILMGRGNLDNEIEVFKSRSLMKGLVKKFHLNVSILEKHQPTNIDLFPNYPFSINISEYDSLPISYSSKFSIQILNNQTYKFESETDNVSEIYVFGTKVSNSAGSFTIEPSTRFLKAHIGKTFLVSITNEDAAISAYQKKLKVEAVNNKANVIRLSLSDPVPARAVNMLNALVLERRQIEIEDNNLAARNTAAFIQERILLLNEELSEVENTSQDYKTGNKLVDLPIESNLFLISASESEKQSSEAYIQFKISEYLLDYLNKHPQAVELIPANLGIADQGLTAQIETHNKYAQDRSRLLLSSGEENPRVVNLNNQLQASRASIKEGIENQVRNLSMKYKDISNRSEMLQAKISTIPKKERESRSIERQRQIKESLYLYLLQKREETSIALAVPLSNTKILDSAFSSGFIVSPKKNLIYSLALILGFLLPIIGIYIRHLFNTRLHDKKDIDKLNLPFIGEIPLAQDSESMIFAGHEDRVALESFRSMRTNLSFLIDPSIAKGRTIAITSSVAKEGKTFISINLAAAIALTGKKVLIWGMDLRTPKLLEYLKLPNQQGLTNYLNGDVADLDSVIIPVKNIEGLYALPSGDIPPNPSEMLMKDRLMEVFAQLKNQFDFIIIDTAPVGLVSDALLIADQVDAFLYVVRVGTTDKRLLSIPEQLYLEKRLKNMALILNEAPLLSEYGYAYGYYGNSRKKSFWNRITLRN
jgi:capsular exopolysaccharide synthesis family protein